MIIALTMAHISLVEVRYFHSGPGTLAASLFGLKNFLSGELYPSSGLYYISRAHAQVPQNRPVLGWIEVTMHLTRPYTMLWAPKA
jgi:hypothetical protein